MYETQIIIDLLSYDETPSPTAEALKKRWDQVHPNTKPCKIVTFAEFARLNEQLRVNPNQFYNFQDTSNLRLYVIGHGASGDDFLQTESFENVRARQVVFTAIARVSSYFIGKRVTPINLISCQSGDGKDEKSSFAARLFEEIKEQRKRQEEVKNLKPIPVIARKPLIMVHLNSGKKIYSAFR